MKTINFHFPHYEKPQLSSIKKGNACYNALQGLLGGKFEIQTKEEELEEKKEKERKKNEAEESRADQKDKDGNQPDPPGGSSCFPASAVVTVQEIGQDKMIPISELKIGSLVKTLNFFDKVPKYSPVMLFAHYLPNDLVSFKRLHLNSGHTITLSPKHMIFYGNGKKTKFAEDIQINDELVLASGIMSTVHEIEDIFLKGAFCPVTAEGTILVDDILASCYSNCGNYAGIDGQKIAQFGFLPMRLMHKMKKKNLAKKNIPPMHKYAKFLIKLSKVTPNNVQL